MRVLIDSEIYRLQAVGGISRIFTECLRRLGRLEPGISVRMTNVENHFKSRLPTGPHIALPSGFRPHRFESRVNAVLEKRWKPDIVHSTYFTSPKMPGARTVESVYDFIYEEYPSLLGAHPGITARKRAALERADCIMAISETTRDATLRRVRGKEGKVFVVYPGVAESFLAPAAAAGEAGAELRLVIGNDRPYWLFVGNRGAYKNFGVLFRAFCALGERLDADLVCVGGEPELTDWQRDLLLSRRLEKRLHLPGPLSDRLLVAAYEGAAAFVFPSCAEGFGIPLLEAMACRTRVIAADIPVFHEIAPGKADFFDPHDQGALEELLAVSLDKAPEASRLDDAHRHASGFTWDEAGRRLAAVYKACTA